MNHTFASLLFTGTLASAASLATAQTTPAATATAATAGTLAGTVADSVSRQVLPFATVVLRSATDTKTSLSTLTDAKGAFSFTGLAAGSYALEVRYLGYRTGRPTAVTVGAGRPAPLAVALAPERHALAEVKVTATKPFIEQQADKLVLNVAASPLAAGGTAADLLSRAPGVLEQGTGYQLRGKTVTVMLDGKLTNLSGDELKNMLAALPANTLDKVELIANPSARYDASAAAIVNLVTTKSLKFGTNGTATVGVGAGRYGRYNAGLNINHRTEKLNMYGGLDRLGNQTYYTSSAVRALGGEGQLAENSLETRRTQANNLRLGFDLDLSKTTSVGVLAKGALTDRTRAAESNALLTGASPATTQLRSEGASQVLSSAVSAYYKTAFAKDKTLRVSADYFGYAKDSRNDYATSLLDASGAASPADLLRDNSPARNSVKSVMADYAQPLYKGTLEAGLKAISTTTDNDIQWEQAPAGQPWTPDPGKTNHFLYRENVQAAYATFSRSIQKVALQVGLRAEQTTTTGTSLTLSQTTERQYLNLFPSVSAQYSRSEKTQFGFSYSRKIERFQFGIVNPFVTYISPYRYSQGNPNIMPSFSHNFEASYSYGSLVSASLSYSYFTNALVDSYQKDDATQVVISSFRNYPSADQLSANLTLMKPLLNNKWQTVTNVGILYARVQGGPGTIGVGNARPAAMLSSNHTLVLRPGLKAEVSASYMSPITFGGMAIRASYGGSLGVSQTVLKGKGTLTLNVTDVFNSQRNRFEVLAAGINSQNVNKVESRFVKLNFSYKFGNQKVKASQRRDTGVEAEKSRME
ncbi:TonB-dependent receptor [Hymenobacter cheonanensis]|uniref:TonB-dependent receptor n=1 Tax=Hymenobacter sp. CA2-7 TaxID=3063993 RepID=UPI002713642E|nr:TonB-dependent receptor [Hymenobacter sp. CA2-7]MDO7885928.1 TonB-dependent receptor [Hymenobacter sp. CA2-7]